MKFVFGPVPSRRLGNSLGISPIPPKTCNYSCVYCQLGRTVRYTNERSKFFPPEEIVNEIREAVKTTKNIDFITFIGDGEPLLYTPLNKIIDEIKPLGIPIAIVSNSSLLYREDVRDEIKNADVFLMKLDAGNEDMWRKINRPHRELNYNEVIEGMIEFSKNFSGNIYIETMLVDGLNTSEKELNDIREVADSIRYDKFFVSIPTRPPAEKWVRIPPENVRKRAVNILNAIPIFYVEEGDINISEFKDFEDCILKTTRRHPLREDEVIEIAKKFGVDEVEINNLLKEGKIKKEKFFGHTYYVYGGRL